MQFGLNYKRLLTSYGVVFFFIVFDLNTLMFITLSLCHDCQNYVRDRPFAHTINYVSV